MHHRIHRWLVAVLLVFSHFPSVVVLQSRAYDRPRPQQNNYSRPGQPVCVAIVGAVARPGVYRFDSRPDEHRTPIVGNIIEQAGRFTPSASGALRIIRERRNGMQIFCSPQDPRNVTPLLDNDVVIVEDRAGGATASSLTHVVCIDLIDRPVVLPRRTNETTLRSILADLRQSDDLVTTVQIIEPGHRRPSSDDASRLSGASDAPAPNADNRLADGTVVLFDPVRVDQRSIPPLPPLIAVKLTGDVASVAPAELTPLLTTRAPRANTGLVADSSNRREPVINPSEPAPFSDALAEPVAPAPFTDADVPPPRRVENLPTPTGPDLSFPPAGDNLFSNPRDRSMAMPPDVSPRAFADRDTSAPSRKRLTQNFGDRRSLPEPGVPYHDDTTVAPRRSLDRKPQREKFVDAAFAAEETDLKSTSSTMLWVLTGLGVVVLLVGRIAWMRTPRTPARTPIAASPETAGSAPQVAHSASTVTPPGSLLAAILENQFPVVHEPVVLENPLPLSGRLDIERLLRVDERHPLKPPVTQSSDFGSVPKTQHDSTHVVHRDQAMRIDRGDTHRPARGSRWNDEPFRTATVPVAIPLRDEDDDTEEAVTTPIDQQREKTTTRLKRITRADRRKVRARTEARRLQQHVRDLKARAPSPSDGTDVPLASDPPPHMPRRAAKPPGKQNAAAVQEGRLDRALAHLQRERIR